MTSTFTLARLMLTWLAMAPAEIAFTFSAFLLSPFLSAWSVIAGRNVLPGRWQWFSTIDDTLDGGQHQWPALYPAGVSGFRLWWQRTCWICRNPAQGWSAHLLGISAGSVDFVTATGEAPGFYLHIGHDDRIVGWGYFAYWPLWGRRYVKIWLGWANVRHVPGFHVFEFQFNPFRVR